MDNDRKQQIIIYREQIAPVIFDMTIDKSRNDLCPRQVEVLAKLSEAHRILGDVLLANHVKINPGALEV